MVDKQIAKKEIFGMHHNLSVITCIQMFILVTWNRFLFLKMMLELFYMLNFESIFCWFSVLFQPSLAFFNVASFIAVSNLLATSCTFWRRKWKLLKKWLLTQYVHVRFYKVLTRTSYSLECKLKILMFLVWCKINNKKNSLSIIKKGIFFFFLSCLKCHGLLLYLIDLCMCRHNYQV